MAAAQPEPRQLVLDLDGYEGPIDVLLALAREQKVDLARISILALADQYLAFIAERRRLSLELAADYLVMAAWLAYLKSRLLLPEPPADDGPSGEQLAAAFGRRLKLLAAMQEAGVRLMARPLLGREVFLRGAPEGLATRTIPVYNIGFFELLQAYGAARKRSGGAVLAIPPSAYHSTAEALRRLVGFVGQIPEWRELAHFLPPARGSAGFARSALAATFAAALELVREGQIELRQERAFGPLYLRSPPAFGR
jgi:segregation and condensation protein A